MADVGPDMAAGQSSSSHERGQGLARFTGMLSGTTGPLIGLILLCVFLSFATDAFFSVRNFLNILDQITVLGIMAVGMTFVILIGGIDLSVGSVMALCMMVMGYLNVEAGMPMGVAIPVGLMAAAIIGAIAGLLITEFKVPPFIATLAMMSIARGLANMITNGSQIIGFPPWFNLGAIIRYGGFLTMTVAVMLVVFVVALLYQNFRQGGRTLLCHRRQSGGCAPRRDQCQACDHHGLHRLRGPVGSGWNIAGRAPRLGPAELGGCL